jgi:dihydrofolate reductase
LDAHDDEFPSRDRSPARGTSRLQEKGEPDPKLDDEPHHDDRPPLRCDELAMLIYSMSVSVDGFIADRKGAFGWSVPGEEQFRFHIAQVRELGGFLCGRRLYETMLVWETDPSLRDDEPGAAFADVWCATPKVVFSRTLDRVQGNARLAEGSVAEEAAAALDATDKDVAIGGAGLAAAAIELGLVDELRIFRYPIVVGGGTPFLPPVAEAVPLELIETRTFGSRVIFERYGRARDQLD